MVFWNHTAKIRATSRAMAIHHLTYDEMIRTVDAHFGFRSFPKLELNDTLHVVKHISSSGESYFI